jgi:hypothetical protein
MGIFGGFWSIHTAVSFFKKNVVKKLKMGFKIWAISIMNPTNVYCQRPSKPIWVIWMDTQIVCIGSKAYEIVYNPVIQDPKA